MTLRGPQSMLRVVMLSLILLGIPFGAFGVADETEPGDLDTEMEHHYHRDAVESMALEHPHNSPHMSWTKLQPQAAEDRKRAEQLVQTLRQALEKYRDYRIALNDGFKPFLPQIPQPKYHFTNNWYALKGAFQFNPAEPTSLLYRKTPDGYELLGAMYTAPRRLTEPELDRRVPLSIAQWHAHINICVPPRGSRQRVDWSRFGLKGNIATGQECREAHGRFLPQIYGWMLHVYPFETTPQKIWTH